MSYCNGSCEYLERDKKHTCAKYGMDGTKLAYIKFTGGASTLAHEQCRLCQNDEWISNLENKIKKVTKDLTELLNNANNTSDYREGIIDALDTLDWCRKI